jgi:protein-S-isoprenylcysteine O-methyltransferase Ste14
MNPSPKSLKFFSVVGYVIMVLAIVPLVYFHGIFSWSTPVIVIQLFAAGLMVWARVTFGKRSFHYSADPTKGGLVTDGPYKYLRHPIYAAILYFSMAGVAGNWSWQNLALFGAICVGAGVRILCEERLVVMDYPEYVEYAKRTKRIVPLVF